MGTTKMGKYDFSSWTIHMAFIITFSSLWGIYFHEWKGTGKPTRRLVVAGIVVLILSTVVVGVGELRRDAQVGAVRFCAGGCPGGGPSRRLAVPRGLTGPFRPVVLREDIFAEAPFAQCHASTIAKTGSGLVAAWFGGTRRGGARRRYLALPQAGTGLDGAGRGRAERRRGRTVLESGALQAVGRPAPPFL